MIKYIYITIILAINLYNCKAQTILVEFTKTERECTLAQAAISVTTSAQPVNYLWSNGSVDLSIDKLEDGEYWVKITDANNNDTTIYFHIMNPVCEPIPESHFTPNNDGYNDTWHISRINEFPEFDLFIYNRWGQQVHRQTSRFIPWDGTSLGLPLPDATYYYVLYFSATDKSKFKKGSVSIIR